MPERADTLEVIDLIVFAPLLYSMFTPVLREKGRGGGQGNVGKGILVSKRITNERAIHFQTIIPMPPFL